MLKMLQLPLCLRCGLILPHLPLFILNPTLLPTRKFIISLLDSFGDQVPQLACFIFALRTILLSSDDYKFFCVLNYFVKVGVGVRARCEFGFFMPEAFDSVTPAGTETGDGVESGFEGVRFTGEIAFAFVLNGGDEATADDMGRFCELNVR